MTAFLLLIAYLTLCLILHAMTCHLVYFGTILTKFIAVGTICGILLIIDLYSRYGLEIQTTSMVLTYAFICELYIFTFTFISSSISVSVLMRVNKQGCDIVTLEKQYTGNQMVCNRLRRMLAIGLLDNVNNDLLLTSKGQVLINRFKFLQKIFVTI